jgi:Flp pilus assembly CpaE family ATPase
MLNILKSIALFQGLEDSDLTRIAEVVKEKACPKGTMLFAEGDKGDAFYLLKKGSVEVLKTIDGKPKVVQTIKAADDNNFFGEMALIANAPRNASLRAAEDSDLLFITKTDFDMMLRLNSFISLRIMTALSSRFRAADDKPTEEKHGSIIAMFSPKAGSGKSSFAANLAAGLAKLAKSKVLLVDLDLQFGDLAFMLGLQVRRTIADLVDNPTDKIEVFKEYLVDHPMGFSVLPAPSKPEQSEMINSNHLRAIMDLCRKHYDYIILDSHSLFQDLTINAMDLADLIYVLMIPNMTHTKSMLMCLKVMENLKYASEKIKVILNREGSQFALSRQDVETGLKRKVDYVLSDAWKHITELIDHKKTIFELSEDCPYRANMIQIMEDATGLKRQEENKGMLKKLKGWFS